MKLERTLTRRIGPLALWVWLVGFVAVAILYRHYKGVQAATGASTDTANAALPFGTGGGGGIGAGAAGADLGGPDSQPLAPVPQTAVDPTLADGGTGTPVVFDPFGSAPVDPSEQPAFDPSADTTAVSPSGPVVHLPGGATYDPNTGIYKPAPNGTLPNPRPRSTTGQVTTKKKTPPHPKRVPPAHPTSKGSKTAPTNGRNRTTAPAAVSTPRSAPAATPNAGARTVAPVSENSPAAQPHPAAPPPPPPPKKPATGGGGGGGGVKKAL